MSGRPLDAPHRPAAELYLAAAASLVILSGWPAFGLLPQVILIVCLAAVVAYKPQILEQARFWFALAAAFALCIAIDPLRVGNHQFLGAYFCLATGLVLFRRAPEWRSQWACNARWLLVGVMAFATIQKLFSPEYVRGDFWGYFLSFGLAGKFVFETPLGDAAVNVFRENRETLATLAAAGLDGRASASIEPPFAHFKTIVMALTWATVAAEAVIAMGYALRPRAALTHVFLLSFVGFLFLIRPEVEFASLILVLGGVSALRLHGSDRFSPRIACQRAVFAPISKDS